MTSIKRLIKRLRKLKPQLYIPPEFSPLLQAIKEIDRVSDLDTLLPIDPDTLPNAVPFSITIPKLPPCQEKASAATANITRALDTFL